ncbi:PaaI family thioesterase [Bradyrhizobium acaciae]|uniref:PaaI family thioesterase n=1 Tax=Bradyrhizobium acaciae TaxID=2683706 RepID=UPI001E52F8EB|nr:PaaI family thioesterase [Bradyrhizobium acaciae]MCC8984633.1 PaaI family thioesterase [Bradyrhizobium acaciae]
MSEASADVPPGAQLLGREWLGFDGEITSIRFEAKPLFTNRHGTIQGGFLAAMLDSATGLGALAALAATQTVVTKTLATRFLKPARVGPITAKAKIISQTGRDMIVEADLIDAENVMVATATAELRILDKR